MMGWIGYDLCVPILDTIRDMTCAYRGLSTLSTLSNETKLTSLKAPGYPVRCGTHMRSSTMIQVMSLVRWQVCLGEEAKSSSHHGSRVLTLN